MKRTRIIVRINPRNAKYPQYIGIGELILSRNCARFPRMWQEIGKKVKCKEINIHTCCSWGMLFSTISAIATSSEKSIAQADSIKESALGGRSIALIHITSVI